MMDWTYYTLNEKGQLVDEDGYVDFNGRVFASSQEAQDWLESEDIRGTVR